MVRKTKLRGRCINGTGTAPSESASPGVKRDAVRECEAHYRELYNNCGQVLDASFQRFGMIHCVSHNAIVDLSKWHSVIKVRPEAPMLQLAIREYQFSLLSLVLGKYRPAYVSLRVFLELILSMVQFSAHEFKLREWLKGYRDVNWQSVIDASEGIFSSNFTKAFCEEIVEDSGLYRSIAEKVYRECSEYVHGNIASPVPPIVVFDEELFGDWHAKAKNALLVVNFALFLRYSCVLSNQEKNAIEPVVLGELGHIEAIRGFFGATIK